MDLLKKFSEVIVASKFGPLARTKLSYVIKINYVIKTGPAEKCLKNKRSTRISDPQLKIKNQIMAYRQTFGKDPLK